MQGCDFPCIVIWPIAFTSRKCILQDSGTLVSLSSSFSNKLFAFWCMCETRIIRVVGLNRSILELSRHFDENAETRGRTQDVGDYSMWVGSRSDLYYLGAHNSVPTLITLRGMDAPAPILLRVSAATMKGRTWPIIQERWLRIIQHSQ